MHTHSIRSWIGYLVIEIFCSLWFQSAMAQQAGAVSSGASAASNPPVSSSLHLNRMEEEKIQIEREKLDEQRKATWLTLATIFFSSIIGFGTVVFNIQNSGKQLALQAKLKALEVVISAAGPNAARQRLVIVSQILGGDLVPPDIAAGLVIEGIGAGHDQNRKDLIQMLLDHSDKRDEVLRLWEITFGRSKLSDNLAEIRNQLIK
ncbi:hypothetical protein [Caballeronia novacaledonica]|uniref:Transmembrane protein n=1 Tax=Caballeronia novacaledonica TaxID=1544861 RepID=A0AA37IL40_9BURK|nr:hypothetical protein [Caballeronia novacaledonica]GJH28796.1 hypothetical protein CBA19CS42_29790 [Caballeronia novacaledonica]